MYTANSSIWRRTKVIQKIDAGKICLQCSSLSALSAIAIGMSVQWGECNYAFPNVRNLMNHTTKGKVEGLTPHKVVLETELPIFSVLSNFDCNVSTLPLETRTNLKLSWSDYQMSQIQKIYLFRMMRPMTLKLNGYCWFVDWNLNFCFAIDLKEWKAGFPFKMTERGND